MEKLLYYVWKHKMFPPRQLTTACGQTVEVIDTGLRNDNSGPDFFNAKVRIDGIMLVGNVEIHDRAADWYAHGHDKDKAYDNVVLHVVGQTGADTVTSDGRRVPQMRLDVPGDVAANYRELLEEERYPPCFRVIPRLSRITVHGWLSRLQAERLERKTVDIERRVERCGGCWESALFVTMARNYGFGVNGDAFEAWAYNIPLQSAAHHRDNLFQTEALFMGQAGLLDPSALPSGSREEASGDAYFEELGREYRFLAHKFGLKPIDAGLWRFLRLRPQNFPYIRISQLAALYNSCRSDLSRLMECGDVEQMRELLSTHVTPYWETHYAFGREGERKRKAVSASSLDVVIINTVAPMLFAYGRHRHDARLCDRALGLLAQLKPENNAVVRSWKDCGLEAENAGDTQALIQLKNEYCDRKDCLRCRIGYEYLKKI